jgi:hypothetical protein
MVLLSTRVITESSKALAVETRRGGLGQTTLADKISGLEKRDDRFLTLRRHDCDFGPAFSNVKGGIRRITLPEDDLTLPVLGDGDAAIRLGEKCLRIEFGFRCLRHGRITSSQASLLDYRRSCGVNVRYRTKQLGKTRTFNHEGGPFWKFLVCFAGSRITDRQCDIWRVQIRSSPAAA